MKNNGFLPVMFFNKFLRTLFFFTLVQIYYSYTQHRTYVVDEICQLLWKLPSSKRALRTYLLPDEEQRQIQMVTALLVQLVHSSTNLPETLRQASSGNPVLDIAVDAGYLTKCHEAATETCCLFWTRILQRLASVKSHDASEVKVVIENLVTDLLTTLNLPEYPSASPILEVKFLILPLLFLIFQGLPTLNRSSLSGSVRLTAAECRVEIKRCICSFNGH